MAASTWSGDRNCRDGACVVMVIVLNDALEQLAKINL